MKYIIAVLLTAALVVVSNSLDMKSVQEIGCVKQQPDPFFNQTWYDSSKFLYFGAGSLQAQYILIQGSADFDTLRDDQFYYDSCTWVTPVINGSTTLYAFNKILGTGSNFRFVEDGILELVFKVAPRNATIYPRLTATFTDNKTYVFWYICWNGTPYKGWMIQTTIPILNDVLLKTIENHARYLGFDESKFAFMKRSNCRKLPASITRDN